MARVAFEDLLPGETPIDDVSGLRVERVFTRAQLNFVEGENIRKALFKYFEPTREVARFDLEWATTLHQEMFGDVWTWAGQFRRRDLNLGCAWTQIQERTYNLLDDLRLWEEQGRDLVEQASDLHHRAVQIHPFINGNGRWARMLTNPWLMVHGSPDVAWPEQAIGAISPARDDYLNALKAADQADLDPLTRMHRAKLRKA